MKKCLNCDREFDSDAKFCPDCGAPLVTPPSGMLTLSEDAPEPAETAGARAGEDPAAETAAGSGTEPALPEPEPEPAAKQEALPAHTGAEWSVPEEEPESQPAPETAEQGTCDAAPPPETPSPKEKKPRRRLPRPLSVFLCALLGVLLFASLLAAALAWEAQPLRSRERLRELLDAVDPLALKVSDVAPGGFANGLCSTLADETARVTEGRAVPTAEDVAVFLSESTVPDWVAERLSMVLSGETPEEGDSAAGELAAVLRENREFLRRRLDLELSRGDCAALAEAAEKAGYLAALEPDALRTHYPETYRLLRSALSPWAPAVLTAICVLLLALLCLAGRYASDVLTALGWALLAAGALLLLPPILYKMYPNAWAVCCGGRYLPAAAAGETLHARFLLPNLPIFGAGILFLAVSGLLRTVRRWRSAKKT